METSTDPALIERLAVGFVMALRREGIDVPVGCSLTFFEALGVIGISQRENIYWAGRSALIQHPGHIEAFDSVFAEYWDGQKIVSSGEEVVGQETVALVMDGSNDQTDEAVEGLDESIQVLRYSAREVLGTKDFSDYDIDELAEAYLVMQRMAFVGGHRQALRRVSTRHSRGRPDLRRTVRQAFKTNGEPLERRFTTQASRLRRVVFLLDISGSMETYARALARFVQAAAAGRRGVEVFTLGTKLTRVTRELAGHNPDRALAQASLAVDDWNGGTRLGESLRTFNDDWGQRGMARGATIVILSDGWDRGAPEVMAEQMARLTRLAYEIIWVNPLKASPGYQPLARGMAAAMPYVDRFIEGHCLQSLEVLASLLAEKGARAA